MSCNNCSTSGNATFDCPSVTSDVTWDGGALCTGFSEGDLNEAIQSVADAICDLQTTVAAGIAVTTDDVTLSTMAGSCFTITTAGQLTDWMDEAELKICTLITDVGAFDFTEPIDFNNTPVTITNQVGYQTLDTITIAANTLNENNEYLDVEFFLSTDAGTSTNSLVKITFGGVDAAIWNLMGTTITPLQKTGLRASVRLTRLTSNTLCVDWNGVYKVGKNYPQPDYGLESNITPLDFTISNAITVQGYKNTGTMTYSRGRTTKYCVH